MVDAANRWRIDMFGRQKINRTGSIPVLATNKLNNEK